MTAWRPRRSELRIGVVGAGTIAGAHSAALRNVAHLYPRARAPSPARRGRRHQRSARGRASPGAGATTGSRATGARSSRPTTSTSSWPACRRPPTGQVVLAAAAAGKHVVCEKPLGVIGRGRGRAAPRLPLRGRVPRPGGRLPLVAGRARDPRPDRGGRARRDPQPARLVHARLRGRPRRAAPVAVPEGAWPAAGSRSTRATTSSTAPGSSSARSRPSRASSARSSRSARCPGPTPSATGAPGRSSGIARAMGPVDVEDAAAALVTFDGGAYGVFETSRVATGKRVSLRLEVFGSRGSADWDLERPDEFQVCLPGDAGDVRVPAGARQPDPPGRGGAAHRRARTGRRSAGSARSARCGPSS